MSKKRGDKSSYKERAGLSKESARGTVCPYCGKRSYASRKAAKVAARKKHPMEHLSAYRCAKAPEFVDTSKFWHFGHLSDLVISGHGDKSSIHGSPKLSKAKEVKNKPIPAALRAMIRSAEAARSVADDDNDNDDDDGRK